MSKLGKAYLKGAERAAKQNGGKRDDLPRDDPNDSPMNRRALATLQKEARDAGSFLASGGKGGLPAHEVLGAMRRTKYRCTKCGKLGVKGNGLSMHHKGGIADTPAHAKLGHKNEPQNLEPICEKCHDGLHKEATKDGVDSHQVTPVGDVGTDRDHGKPVEDGK